MRDLKVPTVEDRDRFFPPPRLVRAPKWRPLPDGFGEFWREDRGEWERIHPMCIACIEGLETGLPFDETVRRAHAVSPGFGAGQVHALLRKYVWKLATLGHVAFDLEPPPDVFDGRFRRVRELGRGGLGVAHLCEDLERPGAEVVVKHPWGVVQDIERGQKAIAIEAATMGAFDHRGIVRFHGTFEDRGLLHLVREYVEGEDLFEHCRRNGVPDRPRRLDLGRQVAEAVGHMHERGFLFFDMRPSNYVVDARADRVVIVDIGNCGPHEGGRATLAGTKGSPGFTSPEVLREGWASVRSDVFGFGRLWYFLSTNKNPRRRFDEAGLKAKLEELGLPEEDRRIIETCSADRPEDRPASMQDVIGMLR